MSAEGLGFGLPSVGGVHPVEDLNSDGEAFGGGHKEEELTPFRIAVSAGHGDYDTFFVDPASLAQIGAVFIAPAGGAGVVWLG